MKKIKNILFVGLLGISFVTSLAACGKNSKEASSDAIFLGPVTSPEASSEITNTPLTLSPSGVVIVNKDQTQKFTANIQEASFSVEGGNSNGSISSEGIYTPPARLPANTLITVKATAGEQTASSQVKLHTGNNIAFQTDTKKQINDLRLDTSLSGQPMLNMALVGNSKNQNLAITENNNRLSLFSMWTNFFTSSSSIEAVLDSNTDWLNVGNDRNISSGLFQSIAQDPDQNLHLITSELTSSGVYNLAHHYSNDGSQSFIKTWINPSALSSQLHPSITFDSLKNLHMVLYTISTSPSIHHIFYTRSTDNGSTWSMGTRVSLPSYISDIKSKPSIATDDSGNNIYICWSQKTGGQHDIYYAYSNDGGLHFNTPSNISHTASWVDEGECSIARNKNNEILILYSGFITDIGHLENLEIYLAKSSDGINFSTETLNSNTSHFQGMPIMAMNDLGQIDILWTSDVDGNNKPESIVHARSLDGGNNFISEEVAITAGPSLAAIPTSMKHDSAGRLHVQYQEGLNYFYEMAE